MSNHLFDKRYTDTNGPAFEVDTKFGLKKAPRVKNSDTLVGNKSSQQHPTWEEPWFYQGARNQQEVQELKQMARELNLLVQMNGGKPLVQRGKLSPSAQLRKDQADWRADDRGDPDLRETQQGVAEGTAGLPDPQNFDSDNDYYNALDAYGQPPATDYEPIGSEGEPSDDWFDESREKVGNMDADAFDDALARTLGGVPRTDAVVLPM